MLPLANLLHHHPRSVVSAGTFIAFVLIAGIYALARRRPTPEEGERRRRTRLAAHGRTIDGTLIEATPAGEPTALLYRYRIGGVTYECSQIVSALAAHLPNLGPAVFGTPIQVRYDPENPADSILLAEDWNGLWHRPPRSAESAFPAPE